MVACDLAGWSADQLHTPPITKKTNPPCHQKKKICSELRDPIAGELRPRSRGEAISKYDPKNGNTGNSGMIVPITPISAGGLTSLFFREGGMRTATLIYIAAGMFIGLAIFNEPPSRLPGACGSTRGPGFAGSGQQDTHDCYPR